jgi:hypothetical protein
MRRAQFGKSVHGRVFPVLAACFATAGLAPLAWGATTPPRPGSPGRQSASGTKATVACQKPRDHKIRCMMTIKGGATINGAISMRITRGSLVVAVGQGRVGRGKATLTMRVLHQMTSGKYNVAMTVTIKTSTVMGLR